MTDQATPTSRQEQTETFKDGIMVRSPLFRRFSIPIIFTLLAFTLAIYFFSVPYLKTLVYSMEEHAVRTNLNNVHGLVRANALAIEAYKNSIMSDYKVQLRNITLFEETFIKSKYEEYKNGLLTEEEAKNAALDELRQFRYGNNNYVWVADLSGVYLSHPDPEMNLRDFSEVRDVFGNYVLTPLIEKVTENNEGYHSYWWQRLGQDLPAEQLTYARLFPQWGWVIGTGVYLDDLEAEVILRKEKMIDELRQILRPITVAKTGYMYIFDSWKNIIIHPSDDLENKNMSSWINPVTGHPLVEDLMTASKTPDHKLYYRWNRDNDQHHYVYDKIDWVRYAEGFDWYIAASVYTDELNISSEQLSRRIIIISTVIFILTVTIITALVGRLLKPIQGLTRTAVSIREGDLSAQCPTSSNDEIGFLATSFNDMVGQLKTNIKELDSKVLARTKELDLKNLKLEEEISERKKMQEAVSEANEKLTDWVSRLEKHNEEISLLNRMGALLQACSTIEDTFQVVGDTFGNLFPEAAGALFIFDADHQLQNVSNWNDYPDQPKTFAPDDCWAVRTNSPHVVVRSEQSIICRHYNPGDTYVSFCLPLVGQHETLGIIHLIHHDLVEKDHEEREDTIINRKRLCTAVCDHISIALSNLQLRQRLHHLSVRDGLTGLFNRRYMEETLKREFKRAERQKGKIGLIMLDVDFFKKFNDTYGHEAGDLVLKSLANQLVNNVRQADIVCRFGGEEFIVILPGSNLEQTVGRAEQIRLCVENNMRIAYEGHSFQVTVSLGAACYPESGENSDDLLKAADDALYRAKEKGRNKVVADVG